MFVDLSLRFYIISHLVFDDMGISAAGKMPYGVSNTSEFNFSEVLPYLKCISSWFWIG